MKRKHNTSFDGTWRVEDGWMSRKKLIKTNDAVMISTPKISSIRYAAMRKLQLPLERNMKQAKITFPVLKKSSTIDCSEATHQEDNQIAMGSVNHCVNKLSHKIKPSIDKENLSCENHRRQSKDTVSSSCTMSSTATNVVDCCRKTSGVTEASAFKETRLMDVLPGSRSILKPPQIKLEQPMSTQLSTGIVEPSLDNESSAKPRPASMQSNETNTEVAECMKPPTLSQHYDLTMKFVPDSQGNKIFDRFTQRPTEQKIQGQVDILSDTEREFYEDFATDLFHRKDRQSTQIV